MIVLKFILANINRIVLMFTIEDNLNITALNFIFLIYRYSFAVSLVWGSLTGLCFYNLWALVFTADWCRSLRYPLFSCSDITRLHLIFFFLSCVQETVQGTTDIWPSSVIDFILALPTRWLSRLWGIIFHIKDTPLAAVLFNIE